MLFSLCLLWWWWCQILLSFVTHEVDLLTEFEGFLNPPPQNFKHCSITCGNLYPWEIYNVILADVPPKLGVTERTLCYLIFCYILSETTLVTHIFWFSPNFCLSFVWVHSSLLLLFLYLPISLSIYLPVVDPQYLSFFPSLWASFHLLL